MKIKYLLAGALFSASFAAWSQSSIMTCKTSAAYTLDDSGVLKHWKEREEDFSKNPDRSQFVLDRATGSFLGKYLTNSEWSTTVLDRGSKEQSYKAISKNQGGYLHTMYLEVKIFSASEQKPFYLADGNTIYTGVCK